MAGQVLLISLLLCFSPAAAAPKPGAGGQANASFPACDEAADQNIIIYTPELIRELAQASADEYELVPLTVATVMLPDVHFKVPLHSPLPPAQAMSFALIVGTSPKCELQLRSSRICSHAWAEGGHPTSPPGWCKPLVASIW